MEYEDDSGDESDDDSIPLTTCLPCRTYLYITLDDGTKLRVKVYIDPGSAGSFIRENIAKQLIQRDVIPSESTFSGAVKGDGFDRMRVEVRAEGSRKTKWVPTHVMPVDKWEFGDSDFLLGIPALRKLKLDMDLSEKDCFHLQWKALNVHHVVSVKGQLLDTFTIAAVAPEPLLKDLSRNYMEGKMISPSREDWEAVIKREHVDGKLREDLLDLLDEFRDQFWLQGYLPPIKNVEYSIQYNGESFWEKMLPLTPSERKYIIPIFEDQVKHNMLGEITDPNEIRELQFVSNMFLKEESDKQRPCINYSRLNANTVKTNLPIPDKETLIAQFAGADFYMALDAKAAYNQVPVAKESQKYLVFVVPGVDGNPRYFYPKRSNFGTSNMPGEFQRLSGSMFNDKDSSVYIDDVTIKGYEGKEQEALQKLRKVLQTAKDNRVTFAFKKAQFFKPEIKMLGEIINKHGRRPNTDRIKDLKEFPVPNTRRKLRSFLGLYNFLAPLRRHSTMPELIELQKLTKTTQKFKKQAVVAPFEALKERLCKWLLLHPFDPNSPTIVMTDSSDHGMGVVVMQVTKYGLRAVAVCSKKWPDRKKPIKAYVKEGMAIVNGMKRFEYMLRHSEVTVITDSENCVDLLTNKDWNKIPALWLRWRRYLTQTFRIDLLHVPGKLNVAADVLSRQTITINSVWHDTETFFSPVLRDIYKEQQADEEIQTIIKELKARKSSDLPKKLPDRYYFMEHGLLKQKHKNFGTQVVIPKALVPTMLYLEHDTPMKGHPGESAMRIAMKQHYWWTGMDEDIAKYVSSCSKCQLAKAKITKKGLLQSIRRASNLFQIFSMDLIDMNTISGSYRYILVVMDYFSDFSVFVNLRSKKAVSVVDALYRIFSIFGPPETLLSDRGREFLNTLVERMTETMGIQHVVTYAYYAQGNAKNERLHAVIENSLRILAEQKPSSWHMFTETLMYMTNVRPNLHTGISPYEIVFGMRPRPLLNTTPFLEYNHEDMIMLKKLLRDVVREYTKVEIQERAKIPPPSLDVGSKVKMVRKFPLGPKYLFPGKGPFTVLERLGTTGYRIRHDVTGKEMEAPRNHLFPFIEREDGESSASTDHAEAREERKQADTEEEEALEEAAKKLEEVLPTDAPSTPTKKRKRTALAKLANFNQPTTQQTQEEELEIGYMVLIQEENSLRMAEIREIYEDTLEVHWYGSSTPTNWSRERWKFYPGWETQEGDISYVQSQSHGKPATCIVPKNQVFYCFKKLNLNSTLPLDIVRNISSFSL